MAFEKILVPTDYSVSSRRALELAFTLSEAAQVTVVHVWDRPAFVKDEMTIGYNDGSRHSLSELIRSNAENEMKEFLAPISVPAGRRLDHHLVSGDPVTAILEEASKPGYQVLVVGTHGRSGVTKLLLGSVTEKLIRLSPIPVLIVPHAR